MVLFCTSKEPCKVVLPNTSRFPDVVLEPTVRLLSIFTSLLKDEESVTFMLPFIVVFPSKFISAGFVLEPTVRLPPIVVFSSTSKYPPMDA